MTETSAETFEFAQHARHSTGDTEVTRSSPIVFAGGVVWLSLVLSGVLQYFSGVNLYYPFVAIFLPFFLLFCLPQMVRLITNVQFWMWMLTVIIPVLLYAFGRTGSMGAAQSLKQRTVYFSLVAGSAVILGMPDARRILRTGSLLVLAWAIPVCFVELLVPNLFSTAEGRSAGLYGNPNAASMAILICVLGAVDLRRQTTRSLLLVSLATAAVFTTFSRSGILFAGALWALHAFLPARAEGGLRGPQRLIVIAFLVITGIAAVAWLAQRVVLSDAAEMRLHSILAGDVSDGSSELRQDLAERGLAMLADEPLGRGVGYVDGMERLPHNTYLYIAIDYGLPGLAFYIVLLLAGFLRSAAAGLQRGANAILLALLLVYASIFTHYVAGTTFYSVAFAAVLTGALILPLDSRASTRSRTGSAPALAVPIPMR